MENVETLYRWSKHVDEEDLEDWELRLLGADVSYIAEKLVKRKRWHLSSYFQVRAEAEALRETYGGGVTEVRPEDWVPSVEMASGGVLRIRDALVVTELAEPKNLRQVEQDHPGRIVLSFPPQLAFGTGAHPTTASCLRFLVDAAKRRSGQNWNLVDLGCGSGILAIAAAKLGATGIVAIENDAMALGYARDNAERHGVANQIEFLCEDAIAWMQARAPGSIEVVAANLFSELLIELMPAIPAALAPGGEIILSGFLTSQTRDVVEASRKCGVPLTDFLRRGKWVAGRSG